MGVNLSGRPSALSGDCRLREGVKPAVLLGGEPQGCGLGVSFVEDV